MMLSTMILVESSSGGKEDIVLQWRMVALSIPASAVCMNILGFHAATF